MQQTAWLARCGWTVAAIARVPKAAVRAAHLYVRIRWACAQIAHVREAFRQVLHEHVGSGPPSSGRPS
jgi:hypothetical protein